MPDQIVTVLDTTEGENGPAQTAVWSKQNNFKPRLFTFQRATGDVIALQGKTNDADTFVEMYEFPDARPRYAYLPRIWRIIRKTDGGVGDTQVYCENYYGEELNGHA